MTGWDQLSVTAQAGIERRIPLIQAASPVLDDDAAGLMRPGRIAAINVPVTLIQGAESPPIIGAIHRALAGLMPQTRQVTVPRAGHMVAATHPDAVLKAMA